jgi:Spy/CpxP family protein refolding chaperone
MSVIAGLAVAGLLCFATAAKAQDDNKGEKKGKRGFPTVEEQMDRFNKELSLTDEQKPKVKKVLEESRDKRTELFQAGGGRTEEARAKMRTIQEDQDKKLKEILTADQYKTYEEKLRFRGGGKKKGDGEKSDTKKDEPAKQ